MHDLLICVLILETLSCKISFEVGHVQWLLFLSSAEVLYRFTSFPTITQWCRKVLLGSMVKAFAKFITWWADVVSLLIQQFWQEQMAMSFGDDYQDCKPSKAPEGWRPLGILRRQQLFCNNNGCPSSLQAEAIEAQLPRAWFQPVLVYSFLTSLKARMQPDGVIYLFYVKQHVEQEWPSEVKKCLDRQMRKSCIWSTWRSGLR